MVKNYVFLFSLIVLLPVVFTKPKQKEPRFIPQTKCYGELGCFSTGGDFYDPLKRPLQFLPQERDIVNVRYFLFTKKNGDDKQELKLHNTNILSKSNFDGSKKTMIITHGFLEDGEKQWIRDMRKTFLIRGDFNVIQLDWGSGSKMPYTQATANTRLVGAEAALMIKFLESKAGAKRENFHFVGHSLGSHVAGYAGEKLGGKLGRITGLDPAGPYFENTHPSVRLDPTDALFVDAIHTDGNSVLSSVILEGGLGMMQAVGHVDFYPNGGKTQPECSKNPIINIIIQGIIEGTKWTVSCHHLRVLPLFTDTILSNTCRFKAFPCNNYEDFKAGKCTSCSGKGCSYMGYHADNWRVNGQKNVKMFLDTTGAEPFCLNSYFLTINVGDGSKGRNVYGNMFLTLHGDKGSSSEIQFFEGKTTIKKSTSYSTTITEPKNLGKLRRVSFRWKYSYHITDPGGLIGNRYLYLKDIVVVNGEEELRTQYCGRNDALRSDSMKTIDKTDSC